jgi:hypothetical protein
MFSQAWLIYLPIIKILMKRSSNGKQKLDMNQTDFQRAAGGRKAKFSFSITLLKGRIQNINNQPPVAKDLVAILQQDDITNQLIRSQAYEFSMNTSFQLIIVNTTSPAEPDTETSAMENSSEKASH